MENLLYEHGYMTALISIPGTLFIYIVFSQYLRAVGYKWPLRTVVCLVFLIGTLGILQLPIIGLEMHIKSFPEDGPVEPSDVFSFVALYNIAAWCWGIYALFRLLTVIVAYRNRNSTKVSG